MLEYYSHRTTHTSSTLVPSEPSAIRAVVAAPQRAIVSWRPPREPNGRILQYTVHQRPASDGKRRQSITKVVGANTWHTTLQDLPAKIMEVNNSIIIEQVIFMVLSKYR